MRDFLCAMPAERTIVGSKGEPPITGVAQAHCGELLEALSRARVDRTVVRARAATSRRRLTIWSHTQGSHHLRNQIARALGVAAADVDVIHTDGAGCYGHNGADDVALDAALLARACGRPVLVQWTREDELASSPCGIGDGCATSRHRSTPTGR